jgi:hypothetical protein
MLEPWGLNLHQHSRAWRELLENRLGENRCTGCETQTATSRLGWGVGGLLLDELPGSVL